MSNPDPLCGYCGAPLSMHCKGGQVHSNYKEDARMVPLAWRRDNVTCTTRHCLGPLCDCVDFVEPKAEAKCA